MKKITITFLVGCLLLVTGLGAQSVQDGINDFYAERYKGAKATFEKLLAANPNNIDASYWLGQTSLVQKDVAGARDIYSKALLASNNAPLMLVGMGQVELNENKFNDATQKFETAITNSRGKKGEDPVILTAVGRAIVSTYTDKEKKGDINYAVSKLELATQRDANSAEAFLNLGSAYLKAKPGEGGGRAFESFTKATQLAPNFAMPYYRLGKLFASQKNWELFEKYMTEAVTKDPRFAPGYYELYYNKLGKLDFTAMYDLAAKYIANSDPDPQLDHMQAQTKWAEKKYDDAINISLGIISKVGEKTKPRSYILLADSYAAKGDTVSAKKYIDTYFAKANPEDITSVHVKIKGDIYLATPGQEETAIKTYMEAVNMDTVLSSKIDMLKKVSATLKARKLYHYEVPVDQMILDIKPNPNLTEHFNATYAYYFDTSYGKARELALKMREKWPNEMYGYQWAFNASRAVDTVKKDSIALPDALMAFEFAQKDSVKYRSLYINTAMFLVDYYVNYAKDVPKALDFINRAVAMDPANENYKKIQKQIQDAANRPATNPRGPGVPKTGN